MELLLMFYNKYKIIQVKQTLLYKESFYDWNCMDVIMDIFAHVLNKEIQHKGQSLICFFMEMIQLFESIKYGQYTGIKILKKINCINDSIFEDQQCFDLELKREYRFNIFRFKNIYQSWVEHKHELISLWKIRYYIVLIVNYYCKTNSINISIDLKNLIGLFCRQPEWYIGQRVYYNCKIFTVRSQKRQLYIQGSISDIKGDQVLLQLNVKPKYKSKSEYVFRRYKTVWKLFNFADFVIQFEKCIPYWLTKTSNKSILSYQLKDTRIEFKIYQKSDTNIKIASNNGFILSFDIIKETINEICIQLSGKQSSKIWVPINDDLIPFEYDVNDKNASFYTWFDDICYVSAYSSLCAI